MRRFGFAILIVILLFSLCSCTDYAHKDLVLSDLPDYINKEYHTSGAFQDFTDYAKYTYNSVTAETLKSSKYFTEVSSEDIEEILLHIDNFEKWVKINEEIKENYDFDKSIVTAGDFFYIKTKFGEPIGQETYGKFDNYSVYYFDIDTQTLYYFHNNI